MGTGEETERVERKSGEHSEKEEERVCVCVCEGSALDALRHRLLQDIQQFGEARGQLCL